MRTVSTSPPHFLTVDEAADLLHVSRSTTYRLVREGELVLVKVHGASRIPLESLLAYRARQVEAATPPGGLVAVLEARDATLAAQEPGRWGRDTWSPQEPPGAPGDPRPDWREDPWPQEPLAAPTPRQEAQRARRAREAEDALREVFGQRRAAGG